MVYKISHCVFLVIASLVTFAGAAALEEQTIEHANQLEKAFKTKPMMAQESKEQKEQKEHQDKLADQISVLHKNVLMIWLGAGAVVGGFCVVGFVKLASMSEVARYGGVSIGASMGCSPFIVHHISFVNPEQPHDCLFVGFGVACSAWAVFTIMEALFVYIYQSVKRDGVRGLRDAVFTLTTLGTWVKSGPPAGQPDKPPEPKP